jgi:alpha-D-ribose 1-methylphosphonate 5-triphosphate synthase subunit PhnL
MKKMLAVLAVVFVGALVALAQSDLYTNTNYANVGVAKAYPSFQANETALTVTNGQALYLWGGTSYVLTGVGGATGTTNTVTLTAPYYVAGEINIRVASGSTNLVTIADSTTVVALGSALVLGPTDTAVLRVVATNEIVKVSTSDN